MRCSSLILALLLPVALYAQLSMSRQHDIPLKPWAAPLYFQPAQPESHNTTAQTAATVSPLDQPAAAPTSLVFVAMTPCRVVDTRSGMGFSGFFGQPSLTAFSSRTFPMQLSNACPIPAIAQAYSFNVTVVPPARLNFLTVYPTGQPLPNASTLNDLLGTVVANALIVSAGNNYGSVDVYASDPTDLIIDINGYYTSSLSSSSGLTLNTAFGYSALAAVTDGVYNTANGVYALQFNTSGNNNTAMGTVALNFNTTGSANTATGAYALRNNTIGSENTATGDTALGSNVDGFENTATGYSALAKNTSGTNNSAQGVNALGNNTTGSYNVAVGANALATPGNFTTTGSYSIGVGYSAGSSLTTGSFNIMIGNKGQSSDDHIMRIGDVQTQTFIAGISGVNVSGVPVLVSSTGQLGIASSSRRYKEDIEDMGDATADLMRLRPVTFRYKNAFEDGSKPVQYGLIAEEVEQVYPDLVARSADGRIETVKYQVLDSMLLNEVQKQNVQLATQKDQITAQTEEIRSLQERLARLESLLQATARTAER